MANLLNHVNEALVGIRVVQAYGIEQQQHGAFPDVNDAAYDARLRSGRVTSLYYAIIEFLHPVALTIVIGYGAVLADQGVIEVGTIIAFTLYLTRLFEPIQHFTEFNTLMQAASAAFTRSSSSSRAGRRSSTRPMLCRSGGSAARSGSST